MMLVDIINCYNLVMKKVNILVCGAINIDLIGQPQDTLKLHDSNPGKVHLSIGGVGCNIARNLGLIGETVMLMAPIGQDVYRRMIMDELIQSNVKLIPIESSLTNSLYMAIHDQKGDLSVSINAMDIINDFTALQVQEQWPQQAIDLIIVDANLSQDTLQSIAAHKGHAVIAADAVSTFKVAKLRASLAAIDILKCNKDEIIALSGEPYISIQDAALKVVKCGVKLVIVTQGRQDTLIVTADVVRHYPIQLVDDVVSVVGAGDAFLAAFSSTYVRHGDIDQAVLVAQKLSRITLYSPEAVHRKLDINWRWKDESEFQN